MKIEQKKQTTGILRRNSFKEKELPADVKEALHAMERTKASRLNRPIFEMPVWTYARID
jgi:hypothetical protein